MTDLVTSNVPERHSGRPSIVVNLRGQEAYLYRGKNRTASSRISSGREGHRTPIGRFQVIRKDENHRSSLYGAYVDASGKVVKANVDSRRVRKPPHSHFVGAPMPYFLEFSPGYGLHQGYLPGEPASHGCIRMPYWKARQFYKAARIGTAVVVKPQRIGLRAHSLRRPAIASAQAEAARGARRQDRIVSASLIATIVIVVLFTLRFIARCACG